MSNVETYDAVVIGSGLGGLTAGALAALAGKRVFVLERHTLVGGAATVFHRPDLIVEVALRAMDGLERGDPKRALFKELGVFDALKLSRLPELYTLMHPSVGKDPLVVPEGVDAARSAVAARFPEHAEGIKRWFELLEGLHGRIHAPSSSPFKRWSLSRKGKVTVGRALDKLFGDHEGVKLALCGNLQHYADSLELSLPFFAQTQHSLHLGGHYIRGGSQALSNHLASIIREAGGTTLTSREVVEVLVEGGRFKGVICQSKRGKDRRVIHAPVAFGNAAPTALAELLPEAPRRAFDKRYGKLALSHSAWTIYLGFKRSPVDLGVKGYTHFVYPEWMEGLADVPEATRLMDEDPQGRVPNYTVVNYDRLKKPGLARKGRFLMTLGGLDALKRWEALDEAGYAARKAAWMEAILEDLFTRFPRLRTHLVFEEMSTAKTVKRYLNTPGGAIMGFAQTPKQAGARRVGAETPLPGMYLASAFARPGGGFSGAMLAGQEAFKAAGL